MKLIRLQSIISYFLKQRKRYNFNSSHKICSKKKYNIILVGNKKFEKNGRKNGDFEFGNKLLERIMTSKIEKGIFNQLLKNKLDFILELYLMILKSTKDLI